MQINPSASIRQNDNEMMASANLFAVLCSLTQNGEGDLVAMDIGGTNG